MKKLSLSIFIISFIAIIGVISFFVLQDNNLSGDATGEPTLPGETETVNITVDPAVSLVEGETKQLFLTFKPRNATLSFDFENPNIASVDNSFLLSALSVGETNLTITATYQNKTDVKIVQISVIERTVQFLIDENIFLPMKKKVMK